jgi:S-methylmethionine-dependent homocysteine/selenocysteine methylase
MSKYRSYLPQLCGGLFLTDGGIETTLIFHDRLELPHFAAFHLLRERKGREALVRYYERYLAIAKAEGVGFVLESPTWRASADWGDKLGYTRNEITAANRDAIGLMLNLRAKYQTVNTPMVVSGCVGPRGDGYNPGQVTTAAEAEAYHAHQIAAWVEADADMVTAMTMTTTNEAIGITRAAMKATMPVAISFTLETDGRLPTGQTLADAIREVDAATANGPAYYMINCAHPTHFAGILESGSPWIKRLRGVRANASRRSHAELDNAPELDMGDPQELGEQYADLLARFPHINVLGGCCGTDHRHIEAISRACCAANQKAA